MHFRIRFTFACDRIAAEKVRDQILNPSYDDIAIARIFDIDNNKYYRVAFFHNDEETSYNGKNYIDIRKAKRKIRNHSIDKVVCCYAYNTGIEDKYLLLPAAKYGEIHTGCINGINILSKKRVWKTLFFYLNILNYYGNNWLLYEVIIMEQNIKDLVIPKMIECLKKYDSNACELVLNGIKKKFNLTKEEGDECQKIAEKKHYIDEYGIIEWNNHVKDIKDNLGIDIDVPLDEGFDFYTDYLVNLDEGAKWEYLEYVNGHINNVKKGYRWMKKNLPELFLNQSKFKTSMNIAMHDLSKYRAKEFKPYSKNFKGTRDEKEENRPAFKQAWNHHQKINKHHWQYWVLINGSGKMEVLDMPFENIIEMICDWWSFSWRDHDLFSIFDWYAANKNKIIVSPKTRSTIDMILAKLKSKLTDMKKDGVLKESIDYFSDINYENTPFIYEEDELNEDIKEILDDSFKYITTDTGYSGPLFHLSKENNNEKIFQPKKFNGLDQKLGIESGKARVCFSPTIDECLTAMMGEHYGIDLYVHIPEKNPNKIYKPTVKEVYDAEATNEIWVLEPVKMKCIGKINVYDIDTQEYKKISLNHSNSKYENKECLFRYKWKWVEKYNDLSESLKVQKSEVKDINYKMHQYTFYDKNKEIGYITYNNNYIEAIFVKPEFRNKGYGSQMLDYAIKQGLTKLDVAQDNDNAIKLYKSHGFTIDKEDIDKTSKTKIYKMSLNEDYHISEEKSSFSYTENGKTISKMSYTKYSNSQYKVILIHNVETNKEYRRKGYAFKLLSDSIKKLKSKYSDYMIYTVAQKENEAAIKLYQKLNFEIKGLLKQDNDEFYVMTLGDKYLNNLINSWGKSFQSINENLDYLEERPHWDTILTRPFDLNKEIKLYHFSLVKDPKGMVYPLAKSVGNKLGGNKYVSWWSEQPDESMLHCMQWCKRNIPDIEKNISFGQTWKPDDGRGYKRSVGIFLDTFYQKHKKEFDKMRIYCYEIKRKIKDLHRGQEYALHEWTIEDEVKANKVSTLTFNDCIKNGSVEIVDQKTFDKYQKESSFKYIADIQKKPWVYYKYSTVKDKTYKNEPEEWRDQKWSKEKAAALCNPKYAYLFNDQFSIQNNNETELEERFETFITRPKEYFNKELHLYRCSPVGVEVVEPVFVHIGSKISPTRMSSFWSDDKDVSLLYGFRSTPGLGDIILKQAGLNWQVSKNIFNDVVSPIKTGKIGVYAKTKEDEKIIKDYFRKHVNYYIYEVTVKGSRPDLGIGWNKQIREFTLDKPIVPDKITHIYKPSDKQIDDIITFFDNQEDLKKMRTKDIDGKSLSIVESMIKYENNSEYSKKLKRKAYEKTEYLKNDFIDYVNKNKEKSKIVLIADAHIGKHLSNKEDILQQATDIGEKVRHLMGDYKKEDGKYILIMGDFIDKKNPYPEESINAFFDKIGKLYKHLTLYILGNGENDFTPDDIFKLDCRWCGYSIETDKYIFTHAPIDNNKGKINVHAHLHGSTTYWESSPENKIKVWNNGEPILFKDVIKSKQIGTHMEKPNIKDMAKPIQKLYKQYNLAFAEEANPFKVLQEKMDKKILNENIYSTQAQKGYADYLIAHITNTKKGFFFIQANCPEMLEGANVQEIENNIIVHDESKYSNEEFNAYSNFFYGDRTPEVKKAFQLAWEHHWTHNPHHPEYWHGSDMPLEYIIEMICDWWSFSWKDNDLSTIFDFWEKAKVDQHKKLSENTKNTVQHLLNILKAKLIEMNLI